jgi:hypothetical protein
MSKTVPAVIVALGLFTTSAAADPPYGKLVHVDTGKVLAVADNSDEAGAKTVLAKDNGSRGQQWAFVKDGDHFKIVNRKSGKVLDVEGESHEEGAAIIQWHDKPEGNDNQRWLFEGFGLARQLRSKLSGLMLDVTADGAVVQRAANEKVKGQVWRVVEVAQ